MRREPPTDRLAGAIRDERTFAELVLIRCRPRLLEQGNAVSVTWQSVKIGTEMTGKCFQPIEPTDRFESFGVQLESSVSREHAGAPAGGFLGALFVRRAVSTEEVARIAAGCGLKQRLSILLALQYRHAIVVRPDAP